MYQCGRLEYVEANLVCVGSRPVILIRECYHPPDPSDLHCVNCIKIIPARTNLIDHKVCSQKHFRVASALE